MNWLGLNDCLICHETIVSIIGWRAILAEENEQFMCGTCQSQLVKIQGETCQICGRPFAFEDTSFRHDELCGDCVRWENDPDWKGTLEKNISLYTYNDFLKEVIARYKYRGDYILARAFAQNIKDHLPIADFYVPIPLSEQRLYERGFNQAEAILTEAGHSPSQLLTRIHSEKQSKKSRSARIHFPQVFQVENETNLDGKSVTLIDDIYTTGSTLRHAAKLLKQSGASSVTSLTLAR